MYYAWEKFQTVMNKWLSERIMRLLIANRKTIRCLLCTNRTEGSVCASRKNFDSRCRLTYKAKMVAGGVYCIYKYDFDEYRYTTYTPAATILASSLRRHFCFKLCFTLETRKLHTFSLIGKQYVWQPQWKR